MTNKILVWFMICLAAVVVPANLRADMATDLTSMLGTYNTVQNSTNPGAYNGQIQGYLSGGALSVRIPPRTDLNLLQMTAPSIRGGCGGIDIVGGGLSYLQPQQLVQKVQSFIANAPATLFFVALQTLTPELATIQNMMDTSSNYLNGLNLDSCKASQALVSKAESYIGNYFEESKDKCLQRQRAIGLSYEDAQNACINGTGTQAPAAPDGTAQSIVHNFTYEAITTKDYFNDPVLTQQILSVLGTVVYTAGAGGTSDMPEVSVKEYPKVLDLKTLIDGTNASDATYYVCANTIAAPVQNYVCQDMTESTNNNVTGLTAIVSNQLSSILAFISTYPNNGTTLSPGQINFINNNWLPIYTYLNAISINPALSNSEFPVVANIMTRIIFRQYMQAILDNMNAAFGKLASQGKGGSEYAKALTNFRARVDQLTNELNRMPDSTPSDVFYVYERIKQVTDITMQRFPKEVVANLKFGKAK